MKPTPRTLCSATLTRPDGILSLRSPTTGLSASTSTFRASMKPSSSNSERTCSGLLGRLPGDPSLDALIDDAALLAAMLRFEASLARCQAALGLIPQDSSRVI